MTNTPQQVSHRKLLEDLVEELERQELPFYKRTQAVNYWTWHVIAAIPVLASTGAALAALLIDAEQFRAYGKALLTALPILGTAATAFLHLYKFREKEALREDGRIETRDIILNARSLLAQAQGEDQIRAAFHQIRERALKLDRDQHRRDIALRSDEAVSKAAGSVKQR